MAVKIRLSRHGAKKNPVYFIVASDINSKRDGDFLEKLGQYLPKEKDPAKKIQVNMDAVKAWVAKGARYTTTVGQLIKASSK